MTGERTLDPAALERLLEITGGEIEFLDELVDTYLDDAVVQLDGLRQAIAEGDLAGLVRPAHSLKSNSDNVGALALTALSRTLEMDARAGTVPDPGDQVAAIERELNAVRAALLEARASR